MSSNNTQKRLKIKDFSHDVIAALCNNACIYYGYSIITGQLLFHGLYNDRHNDVLLLELANFYTEKDPAKAVLIYYYLYNRRNVFEKNFYNNFMTMFTNAMNQYGLITNKDKNQKSAMGDLAEYDKFIFDIQILANHAEKFGREYGSIENAILIVQNLLGFQAGFVEAFKDNNLNEYASENIKTTAQYSEWLDSYPEELIKLFEFMNKNTQA